MVAANVTPKVTALLGMVNWHGLMEHDIPICVDQVLNTQPEDGVAVTITVLLTFFEQGDVLGQVGEIVPVPESTRVVRLNLS